MECVFELPANQNHWGYNFTGISQESGLMFPLHDLIRVSSTESSVCGGWESGISCHLHLRDNNPIEPMRCLDVIKQKSSTASSAASMEKMLNGVLPGDTSYDIRIYDISGRLAGSHYLKEGNYFGMHDHLLSSGLYVFTITGAGETLSIRRFID
jgi:hypothetical protein